MIEDNNKSYQIFKPTKTNSDKYEIIFSVKKNTFIQFVLYAKFTNFIKIYQLNNEKNVIEYNNFPYNGILYSCEITPDSPLIIMINPIDLCTRIIIQRKLVTPSIKKKLNPIQWDKIFVINLARRMDRKNLMEEFFNKMNINPAQYEFFEAYDGKCPKIISKYIEIKNSNPSFQIITPGHFACLLSHLEVIRISKSRGYKSIMILEDDVNTKEKDLISKLQSIKVPNYDLLYLGGIMSKKKHFMSEWVYSNNTNIMGAYGYILNSSIFDVILSGLKDLDEYIDFFYLKNIQNNYSTICLEDIIKTDLTSSDTSNKSRSMIKRLDYIK